MSPLTALMPTHAAITEHLTSAPGVSPCQSVSVRDQPPVVRASAPDPAPISFSKYVILARDGHEFPVVFSREIDHNLVVPRSYTPVSAGFVLVCGSHLRIPEDDSTSLGLAPRPQDETILRTFLSRPSPALAPANASEQAVNPVNPVNQVNQVPSLPPAAKQSCPSVPVRVSP